MEGIYERAQEIREKYRILPNFTLTTPNVTQIFLSRCLTLNAMGLWIDEEDIEWIRYALEVLQKNMINQPLVPIN